MPVSSTWIVYIKILLILSGLVSISMLIKFSVPLVIQFILYQVPIIWSCIVSLLRPPYLYFVINGIIIIIAVTSRYNKKAEGTGESEPLVPRSNHVVVYDEVVSPEVVKYEPEDEEFVVSRSTWTPPERSKSSERSPEDVFSKLQEKPLVSTSSPQAVTSHYNNKAEDTGESEPLVAQPNHVVVYDEVVSPEVASSEVASPEVVKSVVVVNGAEDEEFVVSRSTWTPPERTKSSERLPEDVFSKPPEKPLVSTRVVRAPISSPQGGKPLRVVNPKQNETLENTWKMITEARQIPLLKKRDAWENQDRPLSPAIAANPTFKKSTTFRDRTNYEVPVNFSPSPVRKEPSLSEDELNRRVEAFIKKVNNELRLQREGSLNRYMDMINQGTG